MISEKTHNSILIVTSSNKIQSFLSDALPPYTFSPIDTVLTCLDAKRLLLTSEYDIIIINAPLSDERGDALALDLVSRTCTKDNIPIELTQVEFMLMKVFLENKNVALSRAMLLNKVWGDDSNSEEKTVDVNMRRLRMKIEDTPSEPKYITTLWGFGYKWTEE